MDDLRPASRAPFEHEGPMEPSASAVVRRFLTSHGVREHNHASEIARIIDVDRSQSYRRLKGDVAWSHADLRAVARHFGAKDDHLVAQLEPEHFAQIHRSVVVTLRAISHVTRGDNETAGIHLKDRPEVLPVSRSYLHLFRQM